MFLKMFRYAGGFPLVLDPCKPTNVEKDSKLRLFYPCLFFFCLILLGIYILTEYYFSYGFGAEGYSNMAKYLNISLFAVILIHTILSGTAMLSLIGFALLVAKRKIVCAIYKDIFDISKEIEEEGIPAVKSSIFSKPVTLAWFASGPAFILTGSILYTWGTLKGYQKVTEPLNIPSWRNWLLAVAVFLYTTFNICNPMVASISIVSMDVLSNTADCLNGLANAIIETNCISLHTLNIGLDICKMAQDINTKMASLYLFMFSYFLLGGLVYTYGGLDIVFANPSVLSILLSIAFMCFASVWFSFMCMLSAAGNDLRNAKEYLQDTLETHFLSSKVPSNKKIVQFQDALMRRLDKLAITPYNLFEVGNVSVLGVFATLITYLIIVLQFRAA